MNICAVVDAQTLNWSGSGTHIRTLSYYLADMGHSVTILSTGSRRERSPGVHYIASSDSSLHQFRLAVRTFLDEADPDVVHFNGLDFMLDTRVGRAVWTGTAHSNSYLGIGGSAPLERACHLLDHVVVVNKTCAQQFAGYRNLSYIANGIDTSMFAPNRQRVSEVSSPLSILLPSRLSASKGAHLAGEVAAHISDHLRRAVELRVTGSRQSESGPRIEEAVRGTNARVMFLGWRPHAAMPDLYQSVDVVLAPSRDESCGLTVLEAMAVGSPVFVTQESSASQFLQGARLDRRVCAHDLPSIWVERIVDALGEDKVVQRQAARASRGYVKQHHHASDMAAAYERIWEHCLGRASAHDKSESVP